MPKKAKINDLALSFDNIKDGSTLQLEMDTDGYSVTVFDADGSVATTILDEVSFEALARFINLALNKE